MPKRVFAAIPKGAHVAGLQREALAAKLRARYERGATIRTLMRVTGRSYGAVHQLLQESGVQFRGRGGNRSTRKRTTRKGTLLRISQARMEILKILDTTQLPLRTRTVTDRLVVPRYPNAVFASLNALAHGGLVDKTISNRVAHWQISPRGAYVVLKRAHTNNSASLSEQRNSG